MLGIIKVFSYLILINGVMGYWDASNNGPGHGNMGFYIENVTCSDDGSHCQGCYHVDSRKGRAYLHTFEYTDNPNKLQIGGMTGARDIILSYIRENPSEVFRACNEDSSGDWRFVICMDNDFSSFSMINECRRPMLVVSLESRRGDRRIGGQQVVYCIQD